MEEKKSSRILRSAEARIALSKCKETGKVYGVRMEKYQDGWLSTWAFPVDINKAKREGYDSTTLKGFSWNATDYNGCPYCGKKRMFICDACHKLNCLITSGDVFTCNWCGNTGKLEENKSVEILSGGDLV